MSSSLKPSFVFGKILSKGSYRVYYKKEDYFSDLADHSPIMLKIDSHISFVYAVFAIFPSIRLAYLEMVPNKLQIYAGEQL